MSYKTACFVRLILILELFARRFKAFKSKRCGDDLFLEFGLQHTQGVLRGLGLFIGKHIDSAAVFSAHLVGRGAGMGPPGALRLRR